MLPKTLKNFTVFIDGVGYAGIVEEGTPPKLAMKVEEFQGGGMIGAVDIPMGSVEKMEFEITLAEYNPAVMGKFGHNDLPVSFRGAQGADNEAIKVETRALLREIDQGGLKAAEKGQLKIAFTASYYKMTVAGADVVEIDMENMVFKSGGVDHAAGMKKALGL